MVEDDDFYARVYWLKLEKSGYGVDLASNGQEAIQKMAVANPDLVILDLILPVKDGFQFLAEVRKDPRWQHVPILVVSNLGQEEDVKRAKALGADDYLVKVNTKLGDIVRRVNSLVRGQD